MFIYFLQEVPQCLVDMAERFAAHKEKIEAEGGDRRGFRGGRGGRGGFGGGGGRFGGGGGGGRRRRDDCGIRLSTGIA